VQGRRAVSGKLQQLECGHVGEAVFGQFFLCTVKGCDGKRMACPKCGSKLVEPFKAATVPEGSMHCVLGGHVWWRP
jgi:hypothetical protein